MKNMNDQLKKAPGDRDKYRVAAVTVEFHNHAEHADDEDGYLTEGINKLVAECHAMNGVPVDFKFRVIDGIPRVTVMALFAPVTDGHINFTLLQNWKDLVVHQPSFLK